MGEIGFRAQIYSDKRLKTDFFDSVKEKHNETYFSRLSNLERKRWICEDHYLRENYGICSISDEALKVLKETQGRVYKFADDPRDYNILSNELYREMF